MKHADSDITPQSLFASTELVACINPDWAVLKASGEKVREYLQGQLTQDIERLTSDKAIYSAVLTPKGKTVTDLYLLEGNHDELIILCPESRATALVERLRRFALGYQLRIGIVTSLSVLAIHGQKLNAHLQEAELPLPGSAHFAISRDESHDRIVMRTPDALEAGVWVISSKYDLDQLSHKMPTTNIQTLRSERILKGLPYFGVDWDESTLPLNANLIEFNGVSFEKGCYVGQEITSRMQWRSLIKNRLYRVHLAAEPDTTPCRVMQNDIQAGNLTSTAKDARGEIFGIAYLNIEPAEATQQLSLSNGIKIRVLDPCLL